MIDYIFIKPSAINEYLFNDPVMISEFVNMYLDQSEQDFEKLRLAIIAEDIQAVEKIAHHIKPTMEYLGASDLRIQFGELETLARTGAPRPDISTLFNALEINFMGFMSELREYKASIN